MDVEIISHSFNLHFPDDKEFKCIFTWLYTIGISYEVPKYVLC